MNLYRITFAQQIRGVQVTVLVLASTHQNAVAAAVAAVAPLGINTDCSLEIVEANIIVGN